MPVSLTKPVSLHKPRRWFVWDHNVGHRVWAYTPDDIAVR